MRFNFQPLQLDVQKLQEKLAATHGRAVTDVEVRVFLRGIGAVATRDGWSADGKARENLDLAMAASAFVAHRSN